MNIIGKSNEISGKCKPKRHSPNIEKLSFDKAAMLDEVRNLPEGSEVCNFCLIKLSIYKYHTSVVYASV